MNVFRLDCPDKDLYWKILVFSKKSYSHNWWVRHSGEKMSVAGNFAAAVCENIQPVHHGVPDMKCLGYVLFNTSYLDLDTLIHEATHMAKTYCAKLHRLRDEECLAKSVAYFSEILINHFWRARRR